MRKDDLINDMEYVEDKRCHLADMIQARQTFTYEELVKTLYGLTGVLYHILNDMRLKKEAIMIVFAEAAAEYFDRVEQHIYKGNEIRSDKWMDVSEKQEELKYLDRKRTQAHDELIRYYCQCFDFSDIDNRTQLADKVAKMVFRKMNIEIKENAKEGEIRDSLAEYMNKGEITKEDIIRVLNEPQPKNTVR